MTKKHIIITVVIIAAIIIIYFMFFRKKSKADSVSVVKVDCGWLKSNWPSLKSGLSDVASWSDNELTDLVYREYGLLHSVNLGTDVVLSGTMTRQQKLDAIKEFITIMDGWISSNCK